MNYVIDCYTLTANSALAAMSEFSSAPNLIVVALTLQLAFVRSLFGAGFPLFATAMFHNLGVSERTMKIEA
jgi:MFS transporter, DHA1 family, multidrug resistance protein